MKKIIVLILISIIVLTSCSKANTEVSSYADQVSELQSKLSEAESENERLRSIIDSTSGTETNSNKEQTGTNINSTDYNWITENMWDEIVIYNNSEYNKTYKSYTDEEIINIKPANIIGQMEMMIGSENNTEINLFDYSYIFKKGDKSYKIDVINDYNVEIDGIIYKTSMKATSFGKSLINHKIMYAVEKPLDKIYNSTFSIRKKYNSLVIYPDGSYTRSKNYVFEYYFDGDFINEICLAALKASQKMDNSPLLGSNINSYPLGEFKTYYQSEMYNVDVYYNYIHVYKYDNSINIWYGMALGKEDLFNNLIEPLIN